MNKVSLKKAIAFSKVRGTNKELSLDTYITTDNILQNKTGIARASNLPPSGTAFPKYIKDDVLVSNIRPYLKKIWFAKNEGIASSDVLIMQANKDFHPKFIYYNLFQDSFFEHMMKGSKGTKMPRGDKNQILDFEIPNFKFQTQQKIASILSSLDNKIELNNKINTELEAMAKTLYDYWFVQFDFPNAKGKPYKCSDGKMIWSDELNREIPEGWRIERIKDISSMISRGVSPKYLDKGGVCVLNQKCIRNKGIDYTFGRRHDIESKKVQEKIIKFGDVLVNSTGVGTLGRLALVKRLAEDIVIVDSHVTIVRFKEDKKLFFGYSLTEKQTEIEKLGEGSTGQTELSRVKLGDLLMIVPSDNLQEKFETFYKPIAKKIANNESENEKLSNLRDWLLPMLMNGQVTVGKATAQKPILSIAAEQKSTYKKVIARKGYNKSKNDLDLAIIVALTKQELGINYGEVAMQKTVFNLCAFNSKVANSLKPYPFINSNFGTYSHELTDDLKTNPFLVKSKVKTHEVFAIDANHQKELNKAIASEDNKGYVDAIKKLLSIYQHPFINKETDKIELLNTVTKLILDLKTTDLNKIYTAMGKWKIEQKEFKTKAAKFTKPNTKRMLEVMEEKGLIKGLLKKNNQNAIN